LNVVRKTNSAILGVLEQKSEVLTAIQQQFQQLLRKPDVDIEIFCFFESVAVFSVGIIVPEQFVVLSQYPCQSIAANHMGMTKFTGKSDEGYQRVLGRVQDYLELIKLPAANPKAIPTSATDHLESEQVQLGNAKSPANSSSQPAFIGGQTINSTGGGTAIGIGNQHVEGGIHICR
jgi:hypothetical protein